MISAHRRDPAELILGGGVKQERKKSAHAARLIVNHLRNRRPESQVRAASLDTGVVRKALGVAADIDLIVGRIKVPGGGNHLDVVVALKAGGRHHVEESVSAIAVLARKTAALDLQLFHVLGIDQRRHIGRDIRVDHRYAVEKPIHLMAAAHVEHVVNHVSSGREIGDHCETVGLIGSRRLRDFHRRHHGLNRR